MSLVLRPPWPHRRKYLFRLLAGVLGGAGRVLGDDYPAQGRAAWPLPLTALPDAIRDSVFPIAADLPCSWEPPLSRWRAGADRGLPPGGAGNRLGPRRPAGALPGRVRLVAAAQDRPGRRGLAVRSSSDRLYPRLSWVLRCCRRPGDGMTSRRSWCRASRAAAGASAWRTAIPASTCPAVSPTCARCAAANRARGCWRTSMARRPAGAQLR